MITEADRQKFADQIKSAGVPDRLNRYLTMTIDEIAASQSKIADDIARSKNREVVAVRPLIKAPTTKAATTMTAEEIEADRRYRTWMPSKDGKQRKRPRLASFLKQVRREAKAAEREKRKMSKAAGPKEQALKALRQADATKKPVAPKVIKGQVAAQDQTTQAAGAPSSSEQERKPMKTTTKTTTKPKAAKAAKSAARKPASKKAATANARKPVDGPKVPEPGSMAEKIGKLASRPEGASREELIKLSGWGQQAWKWYFTNSKNNGFCQKFGYDFKVIEKDGEPTRYKITKK